MNIIEYIVASIFKVYLYKKILKEFIKMNNINFKILNLYWIN